MTVHGLLLLCLSAFPPCCLSAFSGSDQPTLSTVLERAGAYVAEFHRQLSGIVAEERYVQDVKSFAAILEDALRATWVQAEFHKAHHPGHPAGGRLVSANLTQDSVSIRIHQRPPALSDISEPQTISATAV